MRVQVPPQEEAEQRLAAVMAGSWRQASVAAGLASTDLVATQAVRGAGRHPAHSAGEALMDAWGQARMSKALAQNAGRVQIGQTVYEVPALAGPPRRGALGPELVVYPLGHQTVEDFRRASEVLATAWRVPGLAIRENRAQGVVILAARMRDPLSATRRAMPVLAGPGLAVRCGLTEDGAEVVLDLAEPWHLAGQGQSRSGKSVFAHLLLSAVASHSDVRVFGVDPSGILLAPFEHSPHARIALGTKDMPRAVEVLTEAVAYMDDLIEGLGKQGVDKTEDVLAVVVVEEVPGLLAAAEADDAAAARKPAERLAPRIRLLVARLLAESAKAGVRCVFLAQRFDASLLSGAARSNIGTRITFRTDNTDAVAMLHERQAKDSAIVERIVGLPPGAAFLETVGRAPVFFKADFMSYAEYKAHVAGAIEADAAPGADEEVAS